MIWFFLLPLVGLILGILLASNLSFSITEDLSVFIAVGLIITLDLMVEGTSQYLGGKFSLRSMLLTYVFNLLFAYFLLTIGNLMRVDLYIALFIVFGIKLFSNLAYISQKFFSKLQF
jgi:small basic protein